MRGRLHAFESGSRRSGLVASQTGLGVIAALALLLAGGVGYRAAAARYARPTDSTPLPAGTLAKLPLTLAGWTGREDPLAAAVIKQTNTDDHLSRTYVKRSASQAVSLWVGYGIQLRDLMPHRPEVCYPGAGWTADGAALVELPLSDGSVLPCRILAFRKGGFSNKRVAVLNYYIIDGQFVADVSALREKATSNTGNSYAVQVQIATDGGRFRRDLKSAVKEFATVSAIPLHGLLPNGNQPG